MRQAQQGMTLLEMLVVLGIAAMALTLGFQSLGQWHRADAAISSLTAQGREQLLIHSWLHDSTRALHPVADAAFSGDSDGWRGTTLQPVMASQGGTAQIEWRLEDDGTQLILQLTEDGSSLQLALPDATQARFGYLDLEGGVHAQWPPALGQHDHLPAGVTLLVEKHPGPHRLWISGIAGILNPVMVMYEPETD